jgi:hypothetical protein
MRFLMAIKTSARRLITVPSLHSGASFPFTDFDYPLGIFKLFLLVLIKGIDLVGLIRCCLTASEQYFTNMHKQTKFTDNASCRWKDGTAMSVRAEVLIARLQNLSLDNWISQHRTNINKEKNIYQREPHTFTDLTKSYAIQLILLHWL